MDKSKGLFLKSKKSKGLFFKSKKSKKSLRRRLSPIQPGDRIDYKNISLLYRFISQQGKILPRRKNKLTLKQQRLITIAIKQARILSLLPFMNSLAFPFVNNGKKKFNNGKKKFNNGKKNFNNGKKNFNNGKKKFNNGKKEDEKSNPLNRTTTVLKKKEDEKSNPLNRTTTVLKKKEDEKSNPLNRTTTVLKKKEDEKSKQADQ